MKINQRKSEKLIPSMHRATTQPNPCQFQQCQTSFGRPPDSADDVSHLGNKLKQLLLLLLFP